MASFYIRKYHEKLSSASTIVSHQSNVGTIKSTGRSNVEDRVTKWTIKQLILVQASDLQFRFRQEKEFTKPMDIDT